MAKPTAADAQLILKLYDLRREAEMRKARNWWLVTFWPMTADDIIKVASALGTDENAWFRQVAGYWDMAASFVNRGILNADLFLEGGSSGEMVFLFAKIQPVLKETAREDEGPYAVQKRRKSDYGIQVRAGASEAHRSARPGPAQGDGGRRQSQLAGSIPFPTICHPERVRLFALRRGGGVEGPLP